EGDDRGIQPAAEIGADADVGVEPPPDALFEAATKLRGVRTSVSANRLDRSRGREAPPSLAVLAPVFDRQSFAGCQGAHAFERRAGRGRAPERERFVDAAHVEPALDSRVTQKRFDLRCERELVAGDRDVQRTDAESVPCEK